MCSLATMFMKVHTLNFVTIWTMMEFEMGHLVVWKHKSMSLLLSCEMSLLLYIDTPPELYIRKFLLFRFMKWLQSSSACLETSFDKPRAREIFLQWNFTSGWSSISTTNLDRGMVMIGRRFGPQLAPYCDLIALNSNGAAKTATTRKHHFFDGLNINLPAA
jgi:hypothetical protein